MSVALHLYNGRDFPTQELDGWGKDGPTFGPFDSVQVTYGGHIKMHELRGGHLPELFITGDYVFYEGVYYGDFEMFSPDGTEAFTEWNKELINAP